MRLDFHTHGKLAKKLPFSTAYTDWLFGEARRAGLDALCLTEHFNTLQFDELYGYLSSVSRPVGDTLELVGPDVRPQSLTVEGLWDESGEALDQVRKPQMVFRMKLPQAVPPLSLLRRQADAL